MASAARRDDPKLVPALISQWQRIADQVDASAGLAFTRPSRLPGRSVADVVGHLARSIAALADAAVSAPPPATAPTLSTSAYLAGCPAGPPSAGGLLAGGPLADAGHPPAGRQSPAAGIDAPGPDSPAGSAAGARSRLRERIAAAVAAVDGADIGRLVTVTTATGEGLPATGESLTTGDGYMTNSDEFLTTGDGGLAVGTVDGGPAGGTGGGAGTGGTGIRLGDLLLAEVVAGVVHGLDIGVEPARDALRLAVKACAGELVARAPGRSVEVRVPPFAAVQAVEGPRHTRGTPPNVVEAGAVAFVELAAGRLSWADATADGRVRAGGARADLRPYLPLLRVA
ncbi:sterol carrier family protein [Frankia sp. CiP1_Cm_nod1]|uniref:sterol carrier family protein n=1 Tax=Frankia sp. CiP1_Cm_nod1 TaxID=2897160 RepID=UPI0020245DE7